MLELVEHGAMGPMYDYLCAALSWDADDMLRQKMKQGNDEMLKKLEGNIVKAEAEEGDVEVKDALLAKATYLAGIGDRIGASAAFDKTAEKVAGSGAKMDLVFCMLRLDMARGDWRAYKRGLDEANALCSKGGDWEKKNKLKVYEALYLMAIREFRSSADLFLNAIATFTATELMSYETCIFYTVALSIVSLDRPSLLKNVVDNPEVLSAVDSVPHLHELMDSLHECRYADFFKALAGISDAIEGDMLLHPHFKYYLKEARVVVYSQYLQSYKSVKLHAMAAAFGVSVEFMDDELANFIVEGRLPAKIDRVDGIVSTTRPDPKNAAYQNAIRHGDHLLNKIQKLSKLVDVE